MQDGGDINFQDPYYENFSALHHAANLGNVTVIETLVQVCACVYLCICAYLYAYTANLGNVTVTETLVQECVCVYVCVYVCIYRKSGQRFSCGGSVLGVYKCEYMYAHVHVMCINVNICMRMFM